MRGFFAIGVDGISKTGNLGNLVRTAHAFGASFTFAIRPKIVAHTGDPITKDFADTAKSATQIPFYSYDSAEDFNIPAGATLVGVELTDDAVDLPSFHHPSQAVYVLGGERTSMSPEMLERCEFVIKIPTKFSLNLATAGAIVLYDRWRLLGGFPDRPVTAHGKSAEKPVHIHGKSFSRAERAARKKEKAQGE